MMPQLKPQIMVNALSTTNGGTAAGFIDTLGYDFLMVAIDAATADVVSNKPTVCKLQESDVTLTTSSTSWTDITAFATPAVIPSANTAATAVLQNIYQFNVDCRARKRYIQAVYSPQTTQVTSIVAVLGRAEQSPTTAAKANVMTLVEG